MKKYSGHMHQLRMNAIDDFCRDSHKRTREIADHINIGKSNTQAYLIFMENEGYLTCDRLDNGGGKGNAYLSTKTFFMVVPEVKPRREIVDKDMPLRHAPHIKPFVDQLALPREFFSSVARLQPI
jgi:hypothetical protein